MARKSSGFTGRLASQSARRPWITVASWGVVLLIAIVIAGLFPASLTTDFSFTSEPESVRGENLLAERMESGDPAADEYVVVDSAEYTVDAPEYQEFVTGLQARLMELDNVESAGSYYQLGDEMLVSDDGAATILPVFLQDPEGNVDPFIEALEEADGTQGFQVVTGGFASTNNAFIETSESDLLTGETIGISMALVVLVVVFGTLISAGVPLLMAAFGILISVGITMIIGQFFDLSVFVLNIMVMIGLAVGIDYSLFILGRYKEERAQGWGRFDSITHAGDTASKAVFFSGLTVVIALSGMLLVPMSLFKSLGVGAIIVVIVSVLATLTLLPAMLSLLGDRVNQGRRRILMGAIAVSLVLFAFAFQQLGVSQYFVWAYLGLAVVALVLTILGIDPFHRSESGSENGQFWSRLARVVMGRPVISIVTVGALMIGLSSLYFTMELGESGIDTLPEESTSYQAYELLSERFSGVSLESPNVVVIDSPEVESEPIQGAIDNLTATLSEDEAFGPPSVQVNQAGDLAAVRIPAIGATNSTRSIEALERLRNSYIPQAFDGVNVEVLVTGPTATTVDFVNLVRAYTPIVFSLVLGMSFLLLLLAFRSLVVPLKSVLLNLLSVGAAYGLLVTVFQHGYGNEIFGFRQVERVDAWVPLLMFTILFGLSMDYHVFLLSRIRERYDITHDNTGSVAHGVRTTASMITGAALIMVAVFSGFAMGELVMFQQIGFGLAVAVILDATVVRSVLVPASMKLLGDWNWYLPSWLQWLPQVNVEGKPVEETEHPERWEPERPAEKPTPLRLPGSQSQLSETPPPLSSDK